mmetsp:Transcript_23484/g.21356  ORF Transcript_23484/g.21356 Transcript_23484/m.21356 type:complete len:300 (-) Transcript_23484:136-1035(-)|eukprot:CAMPEP_0196765696 /NCGR_PEP_ID=MMETSP1095-20130614/10318_1 /TAXON_ID=96789 ORGANISM="Chromulina nebulosa, Strain UTEXLB2642" /NCGR_SAMPLE_ID=MMETSP1095 /ASSEMBLY_ACC=CAM_ASM_000446 /LENGTH=299 /DNA_ID=CAMNT_0042124155 /DNA_START=74 /DNA_END=973 /DNA_ORIENTATION=+
MATNPNSELNPNLIIVFGGTGEGKSSVINAILDYLKVHGKRALTGNGPSGTTLASENYSFVYNRVFYQIIDTAGLNEVDSGSVKPLEALKNLSKLLRSIKDGVSLMIMVSSSPKVKTHHEENYKLFFETLLENSSSVSKLVVITHQALKDDTIEIDRRSRECDVAFSSANMSFAEPPVLGMFGYDPVMTPEDVQKAYKPLIESSVKRLLRVIESGAQRGNISISVLSDDYQTYFMKTAFRVLVFLARLFSLKVEWARVGNFVANFVVSEAVTKLSHATQVSEGEVMGIIFDPSNSSNNK